MTTTIVRRGNSQIIELPRLFLEGLDLKENDTVNLSLTENSIVIRKPRNKARKSIEQRFEEFYGVDFETAIKENPYDFEELDWGPPVGDEVW